MALIAFAAQTYFTGATNWGLKLDPAGPQPFCDSAGLCTTTYQWTVSRVDLGGLASSTPITAGTLLCGYGDANGNMTTLTSVTIKQISAATLNAAPQLLIPAPGHTSCDDTMLWSNGRLQPIFAIGDLVIAFLCALLAALLFFHGTQRSMINHTVLFLLSLMISFALLPLAFASNGLVSTVESVAAVFLAATLLSTLIWRLLIPMPSHVKWQRFRRGFFLVLFATNSFFAIAYLLAAAFQWVIAYQIFGNVGLLLFAINLVVALGLVIWGNVSKSDPLRRDNARILGAGSIVALAPLLFLTVVPTVTTIMLQVLGVHATPPQPLLDGAKAALSIVVFPLALAYVVLKRDLLRTDVLVRRSTTQGIWVLFLAFFGGIVLSVLTAVFRLPFDIALAIFIAAVLAGFLGPLLQQGARWVTEAGLFPEVLRYRRVLGRAIVGAGQTEEHEIANEMIGEIKLALPVREVAILARHDDVEHFESIGGTVLNAIPVQDPLVLALQAKAEAKLRQDVATPPALGALWECFVPIFLGTRVVALVLLGPRDDALSYSSADRDLLFTLANRRAVALDYSRILTALRSALEQQKRIDELKDQFIMTAHHELRTPLTSMIGYMDIVSRLDSATLQQQPQEIEYLVSEALRSGEDLVHLLDTLLLADRAIGSNPDLHPAVVNVAGTLRDLAMDAEIGAEQHQRIAVHCAPDLAAWVDRKAFGQIITNLLSNAIKYSPADAPIEIEARRLPKARMVEVTVRDYGDGIPADQQTAIFEKFIRLERDLNSPIRGTGLGLAIVRDRAEAMGGKVWVTSSGIPGEGSTFHVVVPAAHTTDEMPGNASPHHMAEEPAESAEEEPSDATLDALPRRTLVRYGPPPDENT
jgi:signal transduction histidine kinase